MASETDTFARFLLYRRWYNAERFTVKPDAFMPSPDGETSVFQTTDSTEGEIWQLGESNIPETAERRICGRADFVSAAVSKARLQLARDAPPSLHANIVGWPPSDKLEWKRRATWLAAESSLCLLPAVTAPEE